MNTNRLNKAAIMIVAMAAALILIVMFAGCGDARQDADKSGQRVDRGAAEVIAYPDGFRNVSHKCDGHGHRVYSNSTGDSGNSSQLFVIDDPTCR